MDNRRATALTKPGIIDQLCDAIFAKLVERFQKQLPSKQWAESSSLSRDAIKLSVCQHDFVLQSCSIWCIID